VRKLKLGSLMMLVFALLAVVLAGPLAQSLPPGPGSKQCTPGQNNVGGGPGNSGTGDKHGAPLKAPKSCPGNG
jgi:hypothetical protein